MAYGNPHIYFHLPLKIESNWIPMLNNLTIIIYLMIRSAVQYPGVFRCETRNMQPLIRSASGQMSKVIFRLRNDGAHLPTKPQPSYPSLGSYKFIVQGKAAINSIQLNTCVQQHQRPCTQELCQLYSCHRNIVSFYLK